MTAEKCWGYGFKTPFGHGHIWKISEVCLLHREIRHRIHQRFRQIPCYARFAHLEDRSLPGHYKRAAERRIDAILKNDEPVKDAIQLTYLDAEPLKFCSKDTFPGSIPASLMKRDIEQLYNGEKKYVYLPKSHGMRFLLGFERFVTRRVCYIYDRSEAISLVQYDAAPESWCDGTLFDAEFIWNDERNGYEMQVFDLVCINGQLTGHYDYITRLEIAHQNLLFARMFLRFGPSGQGSIITSGNSVQGSSAFSIVAKRVYSIFQIPLLLKSLSTLPFRTDGLICMPVEDPIRPGHCPTIKKVKIGSNNTIDFYIRLFMPRTTGGGLDSGVKDNSLSTDRLSAVKDRVAVNDSVNWTYIAIQQTSNDMKEKMSQHLALELWCEFSFAKELESYRSTATCKTIDGSDRILFARTWTTAEELASKKIQNIQDVNGHILEMRFNGTRWIPECAREKKKANNLKNALLTWQNIQENLTYRDIFPFAFLSSGEIDSTEIPQGVEAELLKTPHYSQAMQRYSNMLKRRQT